MVAKYSSGTMDTNERPAVGDQEITFTATAVIAIHKERLTFDKYSIGRCP